MLVFSCLFASSFVFFVCSYFSIGVVSLVFFLTSICSRILEKKKYTNGVLLIFFSWVRNRYSCADEKVLPGRFLVIKKMRVLI